MKSKKRSFFMKPLTYRNGYSSFRIVCVFNVQLIISFIYYSCSWFLFFCVVREE